MKVVFLNIEGVLNNDKAIELTNYEALSFWNIWRLNKLLSQTNAKLVVMGQWRLYNSIEQLNYILKQFGFNNKVFDVTPIIHAERHCDEVEQWLQTIEHVIEGYVVLDTKQDEYTNSSVENNFVIVDQRFGLRDEHITKTVRILNGVK